MGAPRGVEIEDACSAASAFVKPDGTSLAGLPFDPTGVMIEGWYEAGNLAKVLRTDVDGNLLVSVGGGGGGGATGDFDSTDANEAAVALFARAAVTGLDPTLAGGSRNIPAQVASEIGNASFGVLSSVAARDSGYLAARYGHRFIVTDQAATVITAQTAFVATTPTLMIQNAAAALQAVIVRSLNISIKTSPSVLLQVAIAIDTVDRLSGATGTVVPAQNTNTLSAVASAITSFRTNATATAVGGTQRYIFNSFFPATAGTSITIDFKDGVLVGPTGSFLVYVFDSAGATAPVILYALEWEEAL